MKKTIITFIAITISSILFAQKSTGVVKLGNKMSAKIDLNAATSIVTLTMTGPSDRWFGLGFDTLTMKKDNGDVVLMLQSKLSDCSLTTIADTPKVDVVQNWTLLSNTVLGNVRTIKATRPFVGDGVKDYNFTSGLTSINLIWAYCSIDDFNPSFGARHGETGCGSKTALFSGSLGLEDFTSIEKVTVYPNPSTTGFFRIAKDNSVEIAYIKVFDINAKLIKEVQINSNATTIALDLSQLGRGDYFIEIANKDEKAVKKIIID
jgi:hypothetical protein